MDAAERERRLAEVRDLASRSGDRFLLSRQTFVLAFARIS